MSDSNDSTRVGGYLAAFAIGAFVGTATALLYAPRSGKETRQRLTDQAGTLKGQAAGALDQAKGFVDGKKAEVTAAVEAGKDAMREERAKQQQAA